jgi:hypothetical protein
MSVLVQSGPVNAYDPGTYTITLRADATTADQVHEFAHAKQHEQGHWTWRLWYWTRWIPFVRWFTVLIVEKEAWRRTKLAMIVEGTWNAAGNDRRPLESPDDDLMAASLAAYRGKLWKP